MCLRGLRISGVGLALLLVAGCTSGPRPQPLRWQAVASDAGQPPELNAQLLVLRGQPIRTAAVYTAPLDIECEVELVRAIAAQAAFDIRLVPKDGAAVGVRVAWDQPPLRLVVGQSYVIRVAVAPKFRVTVNDLELPQPSLPLPTGPFQVELAGAPASSEWRLRRCVVR